jgi:hypothetical protein
MHILAVSSTVLLQMSIRDLELKLKQKDEAMIADLRRKDLEVNLIEEKIKLQYEKKLLTDIQALEQRYSAAAVTASADRDTIQRSVELIKSSLELAPNLLDRSIEAQQHQLQLLNTSYQQESASIRDRADTMAALEIKHQAEIRRIERSYEEQINRFKEKLHQSKENAIILREVLDDKQEVLMEKDTLISQLYRALEKLPATSSATVAASTAMVPPMKENSSLFGNSSPSTQTKKMRYTSTSHEDDDNQVITQPAEHASKDQEIIRTLEEKLKSLLDSSSQEYKELQQQYESLQRQLVDVSQAAQTSTADLGENHLTILLARLINVTGFCYNRIIQRNNQATGA